VASDEWGVPIEAREGLVFAVLAARCVLGLPSTHPGATGAARGRVLGKISWPVVADPARERDPEHPRTSAFEHAPENALERTRESTRENTRGNTRA
jgi:hypothetical protein